MDPLQLIGTAGGILGAVLVSIKRPWAGHIIWLFSNTAWVAHGYVVGNHYLVTMFAVYWIISVAGSINYCNREDKS